MTPSDAFEPILGHGAAAACVATRAGAPIRADRFVADVETVAQRLPATDHLLNCCHDRYAFAVTFCAALVRGAVNLLPPTRTAAALKRLATRYPTAVLVDDGEIDTDGLRDLLPHLSVAELKLTTDAASGKQDPAHWPPPRIARDRIAAVAFTSGTTGEPQPQPKSWGAIVDGARAEVAALKIDTQGGLPVLIGTVSAQHMYGLESTVLMALHGPCAFAAEHPLHPDEVIDVLRRNEAARVLVTTPVHLRALIGAGHALPALDRVVSATAPLDTELASRCENAWDAPVLEVYGCTETGMVATRRTVEGPLWHAMRDVRIEARDEAFWASGGHVARPAPLADRLRLASATDFELLGRTDDIVNIGGKRGSLAGLNRILLDTPGVEDGVIFLPEASQDAARETRLAALIVAPQSSARAVLSALRSRMDAVFLPRPLLRVESLPRNAQGKLPRAELLALLRARSAPRAAKA